MVAQVLPERSFDAVLNRADIFAQPNGMVCAVYLHIVTREIILAAGDKFIVNHLLASRIINSSWALETVYGALRCVLPEDVMGCIVVRFLVHRSQLEHKVYSMDI